MLKQKKNRANEENIGVKIGIILFALMLIIATYIIVQRSVSLRATPTTYYIDEQGVVQDVQIGFVKMEWIEDKLTKG